MTAPKIERFRILHEALQPSDARDLPIANGIRASVLAALRGRANSAVIGRELMRAAAVITYVFGPTSGPYAVTTRDERRAMFVRAAIQHIDAVSDLVDRARKAGSS